MNKWIIYIYIYLVYIYIYTYIYNYIYKYIYIYIYIYIQKLKSQKLDVLQWILNKKTHFQLSQIYSLHKM